MILGFNIKAFCWFNKNFTLDVLGRNDYAIEGFFWRHEYEFIRGGRWVAVVSKARWVWSDTYDIDT